MTTIAHGGSNRLGLVSPWAALSPGVVLGILVFAALAARLFLALGHEGYWGVDGGAYLLSRNEVLGLGPAGLDFPRPPLAPGWLLVPFTALLGDNKGYELFSVLGSMAFIGPFYLLARKVLTPWWAVFATAFLLVDLFHAEMFVTGVLPMIAFAWLLLVIWGLVELQDGPGKILPAAAVVVGIPMIAFTNQTTAGIAVFVVPAVSIGLWTGKVLLSRKKARGMGPPGLLPLVLGGVLALAALPWYWGATPGSDFTRFPGPLVYAQGFYTGWLQAGVMLPAAVLALWKGPPAGRALGAGLLVLVFLMPWFSNDEAIMNIFYRSRYLAPIFFYIIAAWAISRYAWPALKDMRGPAYAAMVVAFVFMAGIWTLQVDSQGRYSDMVTPDVEAALAQVPPGSNVVTNSFMLSLWTGVLSDSQSLWLFTTAPPAKWAESDEQIRCLLGWSAGCSVAAARDLGVTHILIDYRHQLRGEGRSRPLYGSTGTPEASWAATESQPWTAKVFEKGTTILWEVS